jgi:hypothetical protein
MAWRDEPAHPFSGIAEKLKRADQNIADLNSKIDAFIQGGKYPIIPDPGSESWKEVLDYHKAKPIPLLFSVLAGEIVHHLRSCLDHVVWHFSDSVQRGECQNVIEFPIFSDEPMKKDKLALYARKVQAISNTNVLALIKNMQPYAAGPDTLNGALLILHNMDRFDKHRELVIITSSISVEFGPGLDDARRKANLFNQGKLPPTEWMALSRALNDNIKAAPSIAFMEFGEYSPYPVVKGLARLWQAVDIAVTHFANEV